MTPPADDGSQAPRVARAAGAGQGAGDEPSGGTAGGGRTESGPGAAHTEAAGEQRAGGRLRGAGRNVRRGAGATARGAARTGRVAGRIGGSALRTAQRASRAQGAGESGLSRLLELHAFSSAGDAVVAVGLAGTLFFRVPTGQARGQVALFLGLTLLPFTVVAPLIGPFLDRFRRGRRWALGATMALRAFLCWVMATSVGDHSNWQFPAALGVLVASRAFGVARSAAVPRLVPRNLTLVKTNARVGLAGVVGATLAGPLAAGLAKIGPEWALRFGFLVFVGGTITAVLLSPKVDSTAGETTLPLPVAGGRPGGRRGRDRLGIPPVVVTALRSNGALRALSGFLTIFMAFLLREHPFPGWEHRVTLLLALVIGAAGIGSAIGSLLGSTLRSRPPHLVVLVVLVLDVLLTVAAAVFYNLALAVALGLGVGLCQQLGKLSLDAIIQDTIPENVRTSVFARSETVLQLAWVVGGAIGIVMPLNARLGLGVIAALMLGWLGYVLRGRVVQSRQAARMP